MLRNTSAALRKARRYLAAAVALAVLPSSPASAQTAARRTRQQKLSEPARTPAAAPAPLPPIVAITPAPIVGPRASDEGTRMAAFVGIERPLAQDADSSLKVQVEAATELRRLGRGSRMEGVLSVGWVPYSKSANVLGIRTELQSNTFEVVPAFRFAFGLGPKLTFEADTGIGATYVKARSTVGSIATSKDDWGEVLRFAAGLSLDVNDRLRLGARAGLDVVFYGKTSKAVPLLFQASWRF